MEKIDNQENQPDITTKRKITIITVVAVILLADIFLAYLYFKKEKTAVIPYDFRYGEIQHSSDKGALSVWFSQEICAADDVDTVINYIKSNDISKIPDSLRESLFGVIFNFMFCDIRNGNDPDFHRLNDFVALSSQPDANKKFLLEQAEYTKNSTGLFSFYYDLAFGDMAVICPDKLVADCQSVFGESNINKKNCLGKSKCDTVCDALRATFIDDDLSYVNAMQELRSMEPDCSTNPPTIVSQPVDKDLDHVIHRIVSFLYRYGGREAANKICDNFDETGKQECLFKTNVLANILEGGKSSCLNYLDEIKSLICEQ